MTCVPAPEESLVLDSSADGTPTVLAVAAGAAVLALLVGIAAGALLARVARRMPVVADISRRGRTPFRSLLVLLALQVVLGAATGVGGWRDVAVRLLGLALIATVAWLVGVAAFVAEDVALSRYDVDTSDNRHARRVRTQVILLRRLAVVVLAVIALAAMLLTFPSARAAGASILASAGVLSIVAGLAAQTALANVFAGLQLAFTDAIRVDDVVVVEEEWGRIEEITLTYVVVHVWDDRRIVLPSTYFTTTPFQNWTRTQSAVLGSVELDVDWTVPVDEMRTELVRLVDGHVLWDGRVQVLQVTDAVGSVVRLRALVSAADGPTLFDLRCHVREGLVAWLQREHPHALPQVRNSGVPGYAAPARAAGRRAAEGLFTGSDEAQERAHAFAAQDDHAVTAGR